MTTGAVSVKTAAELYDVDRQVIYAAVNSGALPAKRLPGRDPKRPAVAIRIDRQALAEWFDALENVRPS